MHFVLQEISHHVYPLWSPVLSVTHLRLIIALEEVSALHVATLLASRLVREPSHIEVNVLDG